MTIARCTRSRSRRLERSILTVMALVLATMASRADAASITGVPSTLEIAVGQEASIEVFVSLDAGEDASIFQGVFDVSGAGLLSVDPDGYGTTWASTFPDSSQTPSSSAIMSLTASSNRSDHTLLGTLLVIGTQVGSVSLTLDAQSFLQRDLSVAPFFESVALTNAPDDEIALISVVPEPTAAAYLSIGLALLALSRRR